MYLKENGIIKSNLNEKIFNIIFKITSKSEISKKLVVLIDKVSYILCFLTYVLGFIYIIFKKLSFVHMLKYLLVPFITILFNEFLRRKLNFKRPFENMDIKSLIEHKKGKSLPSNHSVASMVIAMSILYIIPHLAPYSIGLSLLIGFNRIMLGLHYPLDIFLGFLIGIFFGYLGFFILF